MRIVEFQFNPKAHKDRFFHVFSFEPNNTAKRSLGSLYIVGELDNALPSNTSFVKRMALVLEATYFAYTAGAEKGFRNALQKANEFLQIESKRGNSDWLGNLHIGVISFVTLQARKHVFRFAKAGNAKVLLVRQGKLVDMTKGIQQSSRDLAKVFGNVVTGMLIPGDKVFVVTAELYDALLKNKVIDSISVLDQEKDFKRLFQQQEKALTQTSGVFVGVFIDEELMQKTKKPAFSLKNSIPKLALPKPRLALPAYTRPPFPRLRIPMVKKNIVVLGLFLVLLGFGSVLFQDERNQEVQMLSQKLQNAQALFGEGERQLQAGNEQRANTVLQNAWSAVIPYTKDNILAEQFQDLQEDIQKVLFPLNKGEMIENPTVLVQLTRQDGDIVPERMLLVNNLLYLSNSFASQIFAFQLQESAGALVQAKGNIKAGTILQGSPVFFLEPNTLFALTSDEGKNEVNLQPPFPNFAFQAMIAFGESIYFLDPKQGSIVKYANPLSQETTPVVWLKESSRQKAIDATSMAIDGNIWVLKGNEIQRYFSGEFQESIKPKIFPFLQHATRIYTTANLPYLYVLDPTEQRLVVFSKFGDSIAQYTSPAFDNLLDVAITADGSAAYLLNGKIVYKIMLVQP